MKAIRITITFGYILIALIIGSIGYIWFNEWYELAELEFKNQSINKLRKEINDVSIHCNAAGNGEWMNARGWSAYTTKGKTKADELANRMYDAAACFITGQKIRRDYSDGDPDWEENFYILSKTKCPAVLTENFFMDNKEDIAYLTSMEGKQNIVNTHVEGIIQYIKEYEK